MKYESTFGVDVGSALRGFWLFSSTVQFGLRANDDGDAVLIERRCDSNGFDAAGQLAVWHDIATFGNASDAQRIVAQLNRKATA